MESKEGHDRDVLVDLEKGNCLLMRVDSNGADVNLIPGQSKAVLNGSWNDLVAMKDDLHMPCCSSHSQDFAAKIGEDKTSDGEMKVGLLDKSMGEKEKKKRSKKPPRPPRPPSTSPLDAADQKLISELSELAMLKRARVERMKALKKMKNSKPASSIGNMVALIITVIFCLVILWQGVFSRHVASISFHGPPISSVRSHGSLISIHFYKKNETAINTYSFSAAPNNTGIATRLEIHGEAKGVTE
uniref:Transmembrane protein n=1 Tax=Leersia perrieri TaxID=77586 RepID=A0A0D9V016_9ORYZ